VSNFRWRCNISKLFIVAEIKVEIKMETSEVKSIIEAGLDCEATVTADGSKYTAIVVSDEFEGKTMVAEQKMVYALVNEHIQSGAIHALTIKAFTKAEWAEKQ
jgi:acid stress-induced BolA-like protein IbaG/YrbA